MAKYRKKPVTIEAIEWNGNNFEEIFAFIENDNSRYFQVKERYENVGKLCIQTLEGEMRSDVGDYIIKGINGEFYPCKSDIFESTYEKVE